MNHWNVAYGETFLEAAAARFDVERKTADDVTFGEFTSGRYVLRVCCLKPSGIGSPRRPVGGPNCLHVFKGAWSGRLLPRTCRPRTGEIAGFNLADFWHLIDGDPDEEAHRL